MFFISFVDVVVFIVNGFVIYKYPFQICIQSTLLFVMFDDPGSTCKTFASMTLRTMNLIALEILWRFWKRKLFVALNEWEPKWQLVIKSWQPKCYISFGCLFPLSMLRCYLLTMDNDWVLDFVIKNISMFMLAKNLYTVRIMLFALIRFIGEKN